MITFLVTITQGNKSTQRKIIAPDSFCATEIAIGMLPICCLPLKIVCKPEVSHA